MHSKHHYNIIISSFLVQSLQYQHYSTVHYFHFHHYHHYHHYHDFIITINIITIVIIIITVQYYHHYSTIPLPRVAPPEKDGKHKRVEAVQ